MRDVHKSRNSIDSWVIVFVAGPFVILARTMRAPTCLTLVLGLYVCAIAHAGIVGYVVFFDDIARNGTTSVYQWLCFVFRGPSASPISDSRRSYP